MDRKREKEIEYQILSSTCPETGLPYTADERNRIGVDIDITIPELIELIKKKGGNKPIVDLWVEFIKEIWKEQSTSSC